MDWRGQRGDACPSKGHDSSDGSVNRIYPITLRNPPRPRTPANQYPGIAAIPSTGFLTPSLHGSPAVPPMPFTPLSPSPARPMQSSPLIRNYYQQDATSQSILHNEIQPSGMLPTSASESNLGLMQYSSSVNPYRPPQTPRPQLRPTCVRAPTGLLTPLRDGFSGFESHSQPLLNQQNVRKGPRILLGSEAFSLPPSTSSSSVAGPTESTPESFYNTHFGTPSRLQELPKGLDRYVPSPIAQGSVNPSTMLLSPLTSVFNGIPGRRGFHPMQAISNDKQQQVPTSPTISRTSSTHTQRFSVRYHGMHTDSNASAEHLSPEENCSLWLTNLPPNVDVHELLASVRNIGRVWCTYINEADHIRHHTAAAKLVFFTPDAAQSLLNASNTNGLLVRGYRVRVDYNRIKTEAHSIAGDASRVLIITGDPKFVNQNALTEYFRGKFLFEIDEVQELIRAPHRAIVEYRFGSYRCQAQMGKMALEKDRPQGLEKVEFGEDPCEVGDTYSAYQVAATRIQGLGL